ncbi:hypothetical protein A3C91_01625 [Candidatus Azambacteria bacterium RIFCSPHIGHO2_02_FULL_52_12]|uniref:SHS2 domain-containing protein n=1 Tax=Candidatus Azambacteria bacterium RIFCSPLOWO2_01_FULL_46_25 TaxID=1797298 RepID=A0A1F5BVA9_9BACT|nr:MAG: hypothetical protein A3C91_01625 [Candidatus Azambacteria bacterium RIFCSPHIGHO2_02_FULL_52_12]OGD34546.1 MAG: hypothetical protein A2988_03490 [Candidatus Azambacteria bacterium RIFCSPLOWO2_01_FULL_46_25]OGD36420.1 MAG: hypothetical protein A2850_01990 [Candidatus Azambacteria bacterium RIFCSPHIGHO2_01_FULL_51_74]
MKLPNFSKFSNLFKPKSYLGVDIGTSSLKIVQLSKQRETFRLDNYGEVKFFEENVPMEVHQQSSLKIPDEEIAELLKKIMAETKTTATQAAFSLPVFSAFSTIIEMPKLPQDEMEKAIQFEARQYVPIPISEVSLGFVVMGEEQKINQQTAGAAAPVPSGTFGRAALPQNAESKRKKNVEVLLVAVPNEIKNKYVHIAQLSGLELVAIEMETFPLARALLKGAHETTLVVDIGARSTDICIVDNGFVRISHNFEFSGVDITKAYGEFTHTDFAEAEKRKIVTGLDLTPGQLDGAKNLLSIVDNIINECERIMSSYFNKTGRVVGHVVLSGGVSKMPGFLERFGEKLPAGGEARNGRLIDVSLGDPFEGLIYPPELGKTLKDIGPSFAVAVGLAMRR